MKIVKYICLLGFIVSALLPVQAQEQQQSVINGVSSRKVNLLLKNDAVSFDYLEVRDTQAFRQLMTRLNNPANYPLSIVKKPVFDPLLKLIEDYDVEIDEYKQLDRHHVTLDSISQLKIGELVKLDALQNSRIENLKKLTDDLKDTNAQLSTQLDNALKVAKECNNGKVRKQLWTGVLGGAVGFSVATLIALLAR